MQIHDLKRSFQWARPFVLILALSTLILPFAACTVEQTEEGELPEVNVDAEGGEMPEYDVDAADVDVETGTETVEVPTVDVDVESPEENAMDDDGNDDGY